eukprot:CAMPEP_0202021238 /NCGR_PEP_ID=MMETSP0905-20130828/46443_1 /ASSEMBLY_ACC=CAM_ASM_000554 /TAXON_ID=420261 /ORGANISM="Thalassiosira antarctica, Strain CCMP982" /LENGTH=34 /DNA_ID= /DNA_START= /DNA_END= /DNA_ORIENTATION=
MTAAVLPMTNAYEDEDACSKTVGNVSDADSVDRR